MKKTPSGVWEKRICGRTVTTRRHGYVFFLFEEHEYAVRTVVYCGCKVEEVDGIAGLETLTQGIDIALTTVIWRFRF